MEAVPGLCVSFDWNHRYSAVLTDGSSLEIHVLISGYGNQFQKGKELVVIEIRCRIEAACWKQTNICVSNVHHSNHVVVSPLACLAKFSSNTVSLVFIVAHYFFFKIQPYCF